VVTTPAESSTAPAHVELTEVKADSRSKGDNHDDEDTCGGGGGGDDDNKDAAFPGRARRTTMVPPLSSDAAIQLAEEFTQALTATGGSLSPEELAVR
jgi:hypothetical protein